jgi:hypothetical protein
MVPLVVRKLLAKRDKLSTMISTIHHGVPTLDGDMRARARSRDMICTLDEDIHTKWNCRDVVEM